jgi:hypothetical protein
MSGGQSLIWRQMSNHSHRIETHEQPSHVLNTFDWSGDSRACAHAVAHSRGCSSTHANNLLDNCGFPVALSYSVYWRCHTDHTNPWCNTTNTCSTRLLVNLGAPSRLFLHTSTLVCRQTTSVQHMHCSTQRTHTLSTQHMPNTVQC